MMGKRTGTALAMLAGVAVTYFGFLRRWHMTWGALRSGPEVPFSAS